MCFWKQLFFFVCSGRSWWVTGFLRHILPPGPFHCSHHSSHFNFSEVAVWFPQWLMWSCTLFVLPALVADYNSVVHEVHLLTHLKWLVSLNSGHLSDSAYAAMHKAEQKYFLLNHPFSGFHSCFLPRAACRSIEVLWPHGTLLVLSLCV